MPRAKDPEREKERREKCRQAAKRQWEENYDKMSELRRETGKREDVRAKLSQSRKRLMEDPGRRGAMFDKINATRQTDEVQMTQSEKQRKSWRDPDVRARRIAGISQAARTTAQIVKSIANLGNKFCQHPNGLERRYIRLLEENFPNQWKYTGNGGSRNIIGGKIPDFTHKSQKKIIEVYGDYWHQGEDPSERIDHFAEYGYDAIVIWESESEEQALDRITELMNLQSEQK